MKRFLFFMFITSIIIAQEYRGGEYKGGSFSGIPGVSPLWIDVWDASTGVQLNSTNAIVWNGLIGGKKESTFIQYNVTNTADYVTTYTTNNFPSLIFWSSHASPTKAVNFRNDAIAVGKSSSFGSNPFTIMTLGCGQTNGQLYSWSFGWSGATNGSASVIGYRLNHTTPTQRGITYGMNTNNASVNHLLSGATTTNIFSWSAISVSNNLVTVMNNLKVTTVNKPVVSEYTVDQFIIGNGAKANYGYGNQWVGGFTTVAYSTNYMNPTVLTNEMNNFNNIFLNGTRKVY